MHLLDEPRDVRPGLSDQVGYLAAAKGSRARGNRGREAPQVVQSSRLQSGAEVIQGDDIAGDVLRFLSRWSARWNGHPAVSPASLPETFTIGAGGFAPRGRSSRQRTASAGG